MCPSVSPSVNPLKSESTTVPGVELVVFVVVVVSEAVKPAVAAVEEESQLVSAPGVISFSSSSGENTTPFHFSKLFVPPVIK